MHALKWHQGRRSDSPSHLAVQNNLTPARRIEVQVSSQESDIVSGFNTVHTSQVHGVLNLLLVSIKLETLSQI